MSQRVCLHPSVCSFKQKLCSVLPSTTIFATSTFPLKIMAPHLWGDPSTCITDIGSWSLRCMDSRLYILVQDNHTWHISTLGANRKFNNQIQNNSGDKKWRLVVIKHRERHNRSLSSSVCTFNYVVIRIILSMQHEQTHRRFCRQNINFHLSQLSDLVINSWSHKRPQAVFTQTSLWATLIPIWRARTTGDLKYFHMIHKM